MAHGGVTFCYGKASLRNCREGKVYGRERSRTSVGFLGCHVVSVLSYLHLGGGGGGGIPVTRVSNGYGEVQV